MAYFLFKTIITALVIASVTELSKRFTFLASLLAAIPLTSLLIFIWIYVEQKDTAKIANMSTEVFYLVLPSLVFFLILPFLLNRGMSFIPAFTIDVILTFLIYLGYVKVLRTIRPDMNL